MTKAWLRSLILLATLVLLAGGGKAEAGSKLAHVDDLKDKRIGALLGSAHVDYVTKTWQILAPGSILDSVYPDRVFIADLARQGFGQCCKKHVYSLAHGAGALRDGYGVASALPRRNKELIAPDDEAI